MNISHSFVRKLLFDRQRAFAYISCHRTLCNIRQGGPCSFRQLEWNAQRLACRRRNFASNPSASKNPASTLNRPPSEAEKRGPVSWRNLGIATIVFGSWIAAMLYWKAQKDKEIDIQRKRAIGKAKIGGPWELLDHDGKLVSSAEYLGKWYVIYFGFTHCPDVCPDEIEKMVNVCNQIDKEPDNLAQISPLFFSVDPERDTPARVKKYVQDFSPRIVGFTGSKEQVDKVSKTFRVYYSSGPRDDFNDYIVDHTIIIYLMDPNGEFVDYFGQNRSVPEIIDAIRLHQMKFERSKSALYKLL